MEFQSADEFVTHTCAMWKAPLERTLDLYSLVVMSFSARLVGLKKAQTPLARSQDS